ncbi:MAG: GNAT family N-acetyltransferase [Acidimicrobiales bacterium]
MVEVVPFGAEHLDGVLELASAEGWPSLPTDPARALRVLTAPGVTTVVARDERRVVGFAEMLCDGEIQAYLALLVVAADRRGEGIGRLLTRSATERAGGSRVDLLSETESAGFYERFVHQRLPGFRIYPAAEPPGDAR